MTALPHCPSRWPCGKLLRASRIDEREIGFAAVPSRDQKGCAHSQLACLIEHTAEQAMSQQCRAFCQRSSPGS